jgi:hypothetical protein
VKNAKLPARNEVGFREKLLACLVDGTRLKISAPSLASDAYENIMSLSSIVLIPFMRNGMQVFARIMV